MFEKHEKWFVLGIIALVIWYFYKKGRTMQPVPASTSGMFENMSALPGSLVNTYNEPGATRPAQSTMPVIFRPAQPSYVLMQQRVSAGQFSYGEVPPVLRTNFA